jgi:hypothetical protein
MQETHTCELFFFTENFFCDKYGLGHILGDFFHKIIWLPWHGRELDTATVVQFCIFHFRLNGFFLPPSRVLKKQVFSNIYWANQCFSMPILEGPQCSYQSYFTHQYRHQCTFVYRYIFSICMYLGKTILCEKLLHDDCKFMSQAYT